MELLQGEAFSELFRSFERTAFHLELQDSYETPEEADPFQRFLRGERDDYDWHQPWLALVREVTGSGKLITRARVVSVPHVDYTRWGLTVATLNIEAGEDIRYLPRDLASGMALTTDDYWLFDDSRVVFTVFESSGRFGGGAQTLDPVIVRHCREVRDQVWESAVPHHVYVSP
ncbi:MAG: DUF6879 family protein [Micromonosporaceae bacterium]